jgi:hypothetical protein
MDKMFSPIFSPLGFSPALEKILANAKTANCEAGISKQESRKGNFRPDFQLKRP